MPIIDKIHVSDTTYDINDSRISSIDENPTKDSTGIVTSNGVYQTIEDMEYVVSESLNDLNNKIKSATEIPVLYFGNTNNPLTIEQKTHNLEVLRSLVSINNELGVGICNKEVRCLFNSSDIFHDDMRLSITSIVYSSDAYLILAEYSIWFFDSDHYKLFFATVDGDLSENIILHDNPDGIALYFKKRIYNLSLGNENVETSSNDLNGFMPYSVDIGDMHPLNYMYEGSLSYDFHYSYEDNYYQLYFDTFDKKIRVRVYSDHITTLWVSRDIVIPITHSDLVTLKTNGNLVPGRKYRITDYVTTVKASYTATRSMNHQFDIIVTALTNNTLDEEAKAVKHEGDTYFANTNFSAWKLWYCLDNDTSKFDWANSTTGKGVIYRMIDEWGNDLPYDFKNIQYIRWKVTAKNAHPELAVLNGLYIGIPNSYSYGMSNNTSDGKWYYTFSKLGDTWEEDVTDSSITGINTFDNVMGVPIDGDEKKVLSNIVCANGKVLQDFLDANTSTQYADLSNVISCNVHVSYKARYLSLFGCQGNNIMTGPFRRNIIVGINRHNKFATNFQDNTLVFFNDCAFNEVGDMFENNSIISSYWVYYNRIGDKCMENVLVNNSDAAVSNNHIEKNVRNNIVYGNITCCTISDDVLNNTIGSSENPVFLNESTIQQNFQYNNIQGKISNCFIMEQTKFCQFLSPMVSCTFKGILEYITIPAVAEKTFYGVDVSGPMRGFENTPFVLDAAQFYATNATEANYRRIKIEKNQNDLVATWQGALGLEGIRKYSGEITWDQWINTANTYKLTVPSLGGMLPNIFYDLGTISEDTTFILNTSNTNENVVNCYHWTFNISDVVPTITWPLEIEYWYPEAPVIEAGKYYDITLVNGIAKVLEISL